MNIPRIAYKYGNMYHSIELIEDKNSFIAVKAVTETNELQKEKK